MWLAMEFKMEVYKDSASNMLDGPPKVSCTWKYYGFVLYKSIIGHLCYLCKPISNEGI